MIFVQIPQTKRWVEIHRVVSIEAIGPETVVYVDGRSTVIKTQATPEEVIDRLAAAYPVRWVTGIPHE